MTMKKNKARRLRRRLAVPLTAAFALLWAGSMLLLTAAAADRLEQTVSLKYQDARAALEEQWDNYQQNLARGLGDEVAHIMTDNLSAASFGLIGIDEGGMAFVVRDEAGSVIRSQLAWGYGCEDGMNEGRQWFLRLDAGLDDAGQLALARWIMENRRGGTYSLYPADSGYAAAMAEQGGRTDNCDGTYARVTGLERPGSAIDVQKIELVRPDGTVERVVETALSGDTPVVVELRYLTLNSVLLPSWASGGGMDEGRNGPIRMELRLANFREAQAMLDRELAGEERSVLSGGGRVTGTTNDATGMLRLVAGQCSTRAAAMTELRLVYGATLLLTAAVALLLARYLSRKVTGPVEELTRSARDGRCREDGPVSELNELAAAFNAARAQLAGQLERERAFTRAAAHELKTPLAVLRTHAEALREDIAPDRRQRYLDVVLDESDRMAGLVGRLLELARLESQGALNREQVELSALVREGWSPLALPLEQKGIALTLELEEIRLEADRERLKETVENLASNALRHCAGGGRIQVSLFREGAWACLEVYNDGPAIPAEDLPHLFEPFYRGDKSRSRGSGGDGLGLAIVRAAVLAHGGSCRAENREGGPCFRLRVPAGREKGPL